MREYFLDSAKAPFHGGVDRDGGVITLAADAIDQVLGREVAPFKVWHGYRSQAEGFGGLFVIKTCDGDILGDP